MQTGNTASWVSTSSLGISGGGAGLVSPYSGIFTITNITSATSTISGALQVAGGVGVGGSLFVGGVVTATILRTLSTNIQLGNASTASSTGIAIGSEAWAQSIAGVAIGSTAFATGIGAHAIGNASYSSGTNALAVGSNSYALGTNAVSVGNNLNSKGGGVAVGYGIQGGGQSIAIGSEIGASAEQGSYSVAIGFRAAYYQQTTGSIILSASQTNYIGTATNQGLYIFPVRADATSSATVYGVYYNPVSRELTTSTAATGGASFNGGTITSPLIISNSTSATSTTTGALQVAGGVGIGGALYVGGNLYTRGVQVLPANIQEFTATASQTLFTVSGGYTVGTVVVVANGIELGNADITATDGTTVTLATARNSGDIIRIKSGPASTDTGSASLKAFSIAMSVALG
jgi:hypothetical protein